MQSGESSNRLADMIKKAISDCELTQTEHDQILNLAAEDGVEDAQEQALLNQLQQLLANGTITKVPG